MDIHVGRERSLCWGNYSFVPSESTVVDLHRGFNASCILPAIMSEIAELILALPLRATTLTAGPCDRTCSQRVMCRRV